jgi:adenylyltransferase/sulfurtransferase
VQIIARHQPSFDFTKMADRLHKIGQVKQNDYLLRFIPDEEISMVLFKDGRVLIHGTNDLVKAKSYYSRYIGT